MGGLSSVWWYSTLLSNFMLTCANQYYYSSQSHSSGPPLQVQFLLDGVVVANNTANVPRPIAGAHGFELPVGCDKVLEGTHRVDANCYRDFAWFPVGKVLCYKDGKKVPCGGAEVARYEHERFFSEYA